MTRDPDQSIPWWEDRPPPAHDPNGEWSGWGAPDVLLDPYPEEEEETDE